MLFVAVVVPDSLRFSYAAALKVVENVCNKIHAVVATNYAAHSHHTHTTASRNSALVN